MLVKILSEVTPEELIQLRLTRAYKPVQLHYGIILRTKRIEKKMYLEQLQEALQQKGKRCTFCTIARWERNLSNPSIDVIATWASCLDLKMSVFIDSTDYRLVKGDWIDKLKALRNDRGFTREKINNKIGVNAWKISLWEKRLKSPTEPELRDWAIALGATACLVFEKV